jgi:hypothetical protein
MQKKKGLEFYELETLYNICAPLLNTNLYNNLIILMQRCKINPNENTILQNNNDAQSTRGVIL